MLNSTGYLIYDFCLYYFLVGASGTLAMQTYGHHILASTGFLLCCYIKDFSIVYSVICITVELSTIFLNIRWFTFELQVKNTIFPLVNSTLLFISYFIVRILFHNYVSFKFAYPWLYNTLRDP